VFVWVNAGLAGVPLSLSLAVGEQAPKAVARTTRITGAARRKAIGR
jgi:hypothetical protein